MRTSSLITAVQSHNAVVPECDQAIATGILRTAVDCYWLPAHASLWVSYRHQLLKQLDWIVCAETAGDAWSTQPLDVGKISDTDQGTVHHNSEPGQASCE